MTDSDLPEMPWGGILRFTAKVAGAVFVGATGLCVARTATTTAREGGVRAFQKQMD